MRRFSLGILVAAAVGCGAVDERAPCGTSVDCPPGAYCAAGGGERRCWPDAAPPVVSAAAAACEAPCPRDGVLRVTASVADGEEVLDAAVTLDLEPGRAFPMVREGDAWVAEVPLRELPFEAFAREVVATVVARDGARNESAPRAADPVTVTRLRWAYPATVPLTSPAVMDDGTVVVGLSAISDQLLAIRPDGTKAWSVTVGSSGSFVTAAPAVGQHAIWVGSEDGRLYAVRLDGSEVLDGVSVNAEGTLRGSLAVLGAAGKEWGIGAAASGRVCAASTASPTESARSLATSAYSVGPVVRADGRVCAASSAATALLRCYAFDGAFNEDWNVAVGVNVAAPPAVDASGGIWTGSQDGKLHRTTAAGATATVAALGSSITDSPVLLAGGDVVVGDGGGTLHRVAPGGTVAWSRKLNGNAALDEPLAAPLVLAQGGAALLVPTRTGVLYALDADGNERWRHALAAGVELRAPNLHTPPGQPAPPMSHAYVAAANGWLYSVVVDGALDAASPWPKAFHDPRNTSRAGPQP